MEISNKSWGNLKIMETSKIMGNFEKVMEISTVMENSKKAWKIRKRNGESKNKSWNMRKSHDKFRFVGAKSVPYRDQTKQNCRIHLKTG